MLTIHVAAATADGPTKLAAFDNALQKIGCGDANLIPLSSIIPPGSVIEQHPISEGFCGFGDRLYCVLATESTDLEGARASAAIAWAQCGDGRGVFAEEHGHDPSAVISRVRASVEDMIRRRSNLEWGEPEILQATSDVCRGARAVSAVVVAAMQTKGWAT